MSRKTMSGLMGVVVLMVLSAIAVTGNAAAADTTVANDTCEAAKAVGSLFTKADGSPNTLAEILGAGLVGLIVYWVVKGKSKSKRKKYSYEAPASTYQLTANAQPATPTTNKSAIDAILQIDPAFSADKFMAWVKEVFIKIQQAWTARDWSVIRPFESEELFSQHNAQLDEYIRNKKINVIEKIGIKSCYLKMFTEDGDKEVMTVGLSAVMRDYVIDADTHKVLESDPNRDWYMNYEMVFNRKKGVKTIEGKSNISTTNCPCCGAPTKITSAGKCDYCGSVITTGEHDWVLTDIRSI